MILHREELEEREARTLRPYATLSRDSEGRRFDEEIEDDRLCFQRDKDRIVHCKAFRRLDRKTQVLMAGSGDHYRTRLTHTLEVAQISRDLARRLGLNEDLCEAIALAHDLGHPPFGHGGEEALDEVMREHGKHFEHNEQSRRIVEKLEKLYPAFAGLNLTIETLDGMIKHQTAFDQAGKEFEVSAHLEAQIVNIADEIAYTNHDMDDGLRSGIIAVEELAKFDIWKLAEIEVEEKYGKGLEKDIFISRMISTIISMMIADLCITTTKNLKANDIFSREAVCAYQGVLAGFSEKMRRMINELRHFLFRNFYMHESVVKFVDSGQKMIIELFRFYMKNPDKLTMKDADEELPVAVKDWIAGMTDGYLIAEFKKHINIEV